jgi:hypothetical protein
MFRIIKKLYLLQYFDNTGCHYQALNKSKKANVKNKITSTLN